MARAIITQAMRPMIQAQIAHAIGIGHLYTRDKTGKFSRIENQAVIDDLLTKGREGKDYWIFAKDPSTQAFTDLMNRALDKPAEQLQRLEVSDGADMMAKLALLDKGREDNARRGEK